MTHRFSLLLTTIFLALLVFPALAWQPFLNNYGTPSLGQFHVSAVRHQNDVNMADLINAFIVRRLQKGDYSIATGWGFPYTLPPEVEGFIDPIETSRARWTPFDRYGSLYDQRHRFSQLSKLAKQRLEVRGFKVRRLRIYDNGQGIYVKWDIKDPSEPSTWFDFDGLRFLQDTIYPKPPTYEQVYGDIEEDNFDGKEVCQGKPDALCHMQNLFDTLGEIFP